MALQQGVLVPTEREKGDVQTTMRRVYIGDHPTLPGYVFVTDRSEATAWLKETSADVYKFDDDSAEDDGIPYLVSTSPNRIIL